MLKKIVSCAALALTVWVAPVQAQDAPSTLPRTVQAALKRAQIPAGALSVFVAPAPPRVGCPTRAGEMVEGLRLPRSPSGLQ